MRFSGETTGKDGYGSGGISWLIGSGRKKKAGRRIQAQKVM